MAHGTWHMAHGTSTSGMLHANSSVTRSGAHPLCSMRSCAPYAARFHLPPDATDLPTCSVPVPVPRGVPSCAAPPIPCPRALGVLRGRQRLPALPSSFPLNAELLSQAPLSRRRQSAGAHTLAGATGTGGSDTAYGHRHDQAQAAIRSLPGVAEQRGRTYRWFIV
jgi:hypothetical protein